MAPLLARHADPARADGTHVRCVACQGWTRSKPCNGAATTVIAECMLCNAFRILWHGVRSGSCPETSCMHHPRVSTCAGPNAMRMACAFEETWLHGLLLCASRDHNLRDEAACQV